MVVGVFSGAVSSRDDQWVTPSLIGGVTQGGGDDGLPVHRPRPTRPRLVDQPAHPSLLVTVAPQRHRRA